MWFFSVLVLTQFKIFVLINELFTTNKKVMSNSFSVYFVIPLHMVIERTSQNLGLSYERYWQNFKKYQLKFHRKQHFLLEISTWRIRIWMFTVSTTKNNLVWNICTIHCDVKWSQQISASCLILYFFSFKNSRRPLLWCTHTLLWFYVQRNTHVDLENKIFQHGCA